MPINGIDAADLQRVAPDVSEPIADDCGVLAARLEFESDRAEVGERAAVELEIAVVVQPNPPGVLVGSAIVTSVRLSPVMCHPACPSAYPVGSAGSSQVV